MKFGQQFEFYKIPEWYTEYLDYLKFKNLISSFKHKLKSKPECSFITTENELQKLRGLYYLTAQMSVN